MAFPTALALVIETTSARKESVRGLYGWLMGRVLGGEDSIEFKATNGFEISICPLDNDSLSKSPITEGLDGAVYISRNLLYMSSIVHNAYLVCPDGNILFVGYEDSGGEFVKRLDGKKPDYLERDLTSFKSASIKTIEGLTDIIQDEILPIVTIS